MQKPSPGSTGHHTLTLSYVYMFLFSVRFSESFWVVFLRSRGLSFAAVGLLETIFHVASLSGEIPTGWIADKVGRKTSLIIGRVLSIVAALLTLRVHSFTGFAIAFALSALGYTCHSGAYDALVFDELKLDGRENQFTKVMGTVNATYLIGGSLAAVLGGLIAQRALLLLYIFSIGVDLLAVLLLLPLRERPLPAVAAARAERIDPLRDLRSLISTLRDRRLASLMLLYAGVSALGTSFFFYGQSYMRELGVPLTVLGGVGMAGRLLAVLPSREAHRLERRFGARPTLIAGSLAFVAGVIVAGLLGQGSLLAQTLFIGLTLLCGVINETLYPVFCNGMNALAASERRATVLSTAGMFFSVVMMVIFPAIGALGDRFGLGRGFIISGLAVLTLVLAVARGWRSTPTAATAPAQDN